MRRRLSIAFAALILFLSPLLSAPLGAAGEEEVRATFTAFQKALKDADPDKLWPLLDTASQTAAERAALSLKNNYLRANADGKKRLEKLFGLSGDEMKDLTGKLYLKTKRFLGKYDEVPDSKIDKVSVDGDRATLTYVEIDRDKIQQPLVRQGGKWRLTIKIP